MKNLLLFIYPLLYLLFPLFNVWIMSFCDVRFYLIRNIINSYIFSYTLIFISLNYISDLGLTKNSLIMLLFVVIFYKSNIAYKKIFIGRHITTRISNLALLLFELFSPFLVQYIPQNAAVISVKFFITLALFKLFIYLFALISKILLVKNTKFENIKYPELENIKKTLDKLPDIYYIVPDSYTGNNVLKKYYNFDNYEFENHLKSKNFKIYDNAKSNYSITICSIPSTLNMDYIENFCNFDNLKEETALLKLVNYHFNNKTVNLLKKLGYKYYHLQNYWEEDISGKYKSLADIKMFMYKGFRSLHRAVFSRTAIEGLIIKLVGKDTRKSINKTFDELEKISKYNKEEPKFVMAHLICPHEPFYFDKNGNDADSKMDSNNYTDYRKLYVEQVKYLNKKLEEITDCIISNNPNSIIIIQADHGAASFMVKEGKRLQNPNNEILEERFSIFRAIYSPNIPINLNTSVNLFRIIFNSITNANFKILEDYHIFQKPVKYGFLLNKTIKMDGEI